MYEVQIEDKSGKQVNTNIEDIKDLQQELDKHPQYKGVKVRRLVKDESGVKKD